MDGGIPVNDIDDGDRQRIADWIELLAAGPDHAGGIALPTHHLGTTLQPDDEDYQPPVENLFELVVPGTQWLCRYQVHYDARTVHLVAFTQAPYH